MKPSWRPFSYASALTDAAALESWGATYRGLSKLAAGPGAVLVSFLFVFPAWTLIQRAGATDAAIFASALLVGIGILFAFAVGAWAGKRTDAWYESRFGISRWQDHGARYAHRARDTGTLGLALAGFVAFVGFGIQPVYQFWLLAALPALSAAAAAWRPAWVALTLLGAGAAVVQALAPTPFWIPMVILFVLHSTGYVLDHLALVRAVRGPAQPLGDPA